jgi:ankyrin repeat protein
VELLMASGAKLSLQDATEKTALSHAESEGMQDIIELLKKAGATR